MERPTRNPDDVTWMDETFGVAVDVEGGAVSADGRMTAAAARLVVVSRGAVVSDLPSDLPLPSTLNGDACLELALILLTAAAAIDPTAVARTLAKSREETALLRALLAEPTDVH